MMKVVDQVNIDKLHDELKQARQNEAARSQA
jgi:hypothetical protein